MAKPFRVEDKVWWDMGLTKKLDGSKERWIGEAEITSIEGVIMFLRYYNGIMSAKRIGNRWLAVKSDRGYKHRIHHAQ